MKKLAVFLILWLLPSAGMAEFSIKFENTVDETMTYMLYWIDNPFELKAPFNMAGGELEAMESREISPLKSGSYIVTWQGKDSRTNNVRMQIEESVTSVTVTPDKYIARH